MTTGALPRRAFVSLAMRVVAALLPATRRLRIGGSSEDDGNLLQRWIDGTAAGGELVIPPRATPYRITRPLRLDRPMTLRASGVSIRQVVVGQPGVLVTARGVRIHGLTMHGPGARSRDDHAAGVLCRGAATRRLDGIVLTDLLIHDFSHGIRVSMVDDLLVRDSRIERMAYAGIMLESVRRSTIARNRIIGVVGAPNAYGIAVSRRGGRLAQHPRSAQVEVLDNVIDDVPHWAGLDTHGGIDIAFRRNRVSNVRIGIELGPSEALAPIRCRALNNDVRCGRARPQVGVEITGLPGVPAIDCAIIENTIDGFGTQGSPFGAAVRVQHADRPSVRGNRVSRSLQSAIALFGRVRGARVDDNQIDGIDASGGPFIAAIKIPGGSVTGTIVGNRIEAGLAAGIRAHAPQAVHVARNTIRTTGRSYHPNRAAFTAPVP